MRMEWKKSDAKKPQQHKKSKKNAKNDQKVLVRTLRARGIEYFVSNLTYADGSANHTEDGTHGGQKKSSEKNGGQA